MIKNIKKEILKALLLGSLLPKHPLEFYERVLTFLEVQVEKMLVRPASYEPKVWQKVVLGIEESLGKGLSPFFDELECAEIAEKVDLRIYDIRSMAPFTLCHNADFTIARLCYAVCRALKPAIVLETGVAYGVTSAFILKALEVNGNGVLHSVDLPPLGRNADRFVGILIPEALQHRWRLHRGVSKRVLPLLLEQLGMVDIFIHDSLHTLRNMGREFQMITQYLARPAVVIADDVNSNTAFLEWMNRTRADFWAVLRKEEKKGLFGVSVFFNASSPRS